MIAITGSALTGFSAPSLVAPRTALSINMVATVGSTGKSEFCYGLPGSTLRPRHRARAPA